MYRLFSSLIFTFLFVSGVYAQEQGKIVQLSADNFAQKLKETPTAVIVDVRTPEEFSEGHLRTALNINWKADDFMDKLASVDKNKPVFVYCFSGGRSAAAVAKMKLEGFCNIYELKGGMLKWRAANLPEVARKAAQGMTLAQFEAMLEGEKLVLVDFYAEWCAPCKKMEPYLKEIADEMKDRVTVIRVNIDENRFLSEELKVDAIPVLHIYKKGKLLWNHTGYIEKSNVLKRLR